MRRLTDAEKTALYETIVANLNMIADCEQRKANFVSEINKEIKAYQLEVDKARLQLNEDSFETGAQTELPLRG